MSFGPACERCGANSYEGSMDSLPIRCPFCGKIKRRGSREELIEAIKAAEHALLAGIGFVNGMSILGAKAMTTTFKDALNKIRDC